ncbi:MAG TPA: DUF255 domain-containing protein [Opitutaceae bacterium]|nr:DUF255 domain-containing protein [Opitutaceae bacterium]
MSRLLIAAMVFAGAARAGAADAIAWQPWSDAAFATAKREHRFVIMDLEAVWCHWCHVMDETTYRDPKVIALMGARYVAVRVDQDSRPDLANRYEDYGWPATIVFAADGSEIVRRRGYLAPAEMASMLQAIIDDPSPGPSVSSEASPRYPADARPDDALMSGVRNRLLSGYDRAVGGWSGEHKFLDADNVEYCLRAAARGDSEAAAIGRDMLRLQRQLFDPAWGGVYQYSAAGDWVHPHFEKIMAVQADNLRIYAMAAEQWPDWGYQAAADQIRRFLKGFLQGADGAFYTSQDADLVPGEHAADYFLLDDGARRARGVPRVDTHRYARENGWAAAALCALSGATGDAAPLNEAERAAEWVVAHRALPGGGFRHDEADAAGPFLGDTLSMGSAFLALYQATGRAAWLARAEGAADYIRGHFARGAEPGFATSDTTSPSFPGPQPEFDESIGLARFANLLGRATARPEDRALAESSLRWALSPDKVGRRGPYAGGLLLACDELRTEPLHVTVVGHRDDPAARALFSAALRAPTAYKLVEWWDRREGPPPRGESIFPDLDKSAAYLCANGACSSPIRDAQALTRRLDKAVAAAGGQ